MCFSCEGMSALTNKVQDLRKQGLSNQKIADLFNLWSVGTSSGEGKWYAKTVRWLILFKFIFDCLEPFFDRFKLSFVYTLIFIENDQVLFNSFFKVGEGFREMIVVF